MKEEKTSLHVRQCLHRTGTIIKYHETSLLFTLEELDHHVTFN
jgi:hypothetical protein